MYNLLKHRPIEILSVFWRTLIILKIGHDCMTELKKDIDRTNNLYPPERLIASMLMFLLIVLFFYVALRHPEMIWI